MDKIIDFAAGRAIFKIRPFHNDLHETLVFFMFKMGVILVHEVAIWLVWRQPNTGNPSRQLITSNLFDESPFFLVGWCTNFFFKKIRVLKVVSLLAFDMP